ncbi:MAG: hypothetical protein WDN44_10410 [Sphingomonas sp.]
MTKKIARQPIPSTSQPPIGGPIAAAIAPAAAQVPIARPRSSPAKALPRIARAVGQQDRRADALDGARAEQQRQPLRERRRPPTPR